MEMTTIKMMTITMTNEIITYKAISTAVVVSVAAINIQLKHT